MKGLLRKDFYMLWSYSRMFLIFLIIFLAASLFQPESVFFSFYPGIVMGMLPITLIYYDESFKWHIYCQTMPLSRKTVVVEKYGMLLILTGAAALVSALVQAVGGFFLHTLSPMEALERSVVTLSLSLAATSLVMPLVFRLGPEKGRLTYIVSIALFCGIAGSLDGLGLTSLPEFSPILLLILALGVTFGSMVLSIRLYEKREL